MSDVEGRLNDQVKDSVRAINRETAGAKSAIFDIMRIHINTIEQTHADDRLKQQVYIMHYLSTKVTENRCAQDNLPGSLWRECAVDMMKSYRYE